MTRISMIALVLAAFVFGACSNPRLTASGEDPDAGQNNNTVQPDPDPDLDPDYSVTCTLKSSDKVAVWLETAGGYWVFGKTYTVEQCPDGPKYKLDFNPTGIFVVSGSNDLEISCNKYVNLYWIDGDPAQSHNFWDFEQTLNNIWFLPGYWEFNFFPDSEGQAEGFELAASAFICALGLDMLNLGCDGHIPREFFLHDGEVTHATYTEGSYMPILRFGLVN
jgi:hypothetical protein